MQDLKSTNLPGLNRPQIRSAAAAAGFAIKGVPTAMLRSRLARVQRAQRMGRPL